LPRELFSGNHELLQKGFSPMTVRFFMLQSHYSSTLDFSNEALLAAEKGFKKLGNALSIIKTLKANEAETKLNKELDDELNRLSKECYLNMSDDFNTAKVLAVLFEMSARINDMKSGNLQLNTISLETFESYKKTFVGFMEDVLGLCEEITRDHDKIDGVIKVLIDLRKKARTDRNFALSDKIRDDLKAMGVQLMDGKDGEMSYVIE
jgi:cysteinyl-tRNA synthetase